VINLGNWVEIAERNHVAKALHWSEENFLIWAFHPRKGLSTIDMIRAQNLSATSRT